MMCFSKILTLKHPSSTTYDGYNEKTITYTTTDIPVVCTETKIERNENEQHLSETTYTYLYYGDAVIPAPGDLIDEVPIVLVKGAYKPGAPMIITARKVSV